MEENFYIFKTRLKVMIDDINTIISGYNQFEKKISDFLKNLKKVFLKSFR